MRFRPLAIGRAEIRRSGVIVHFEEEYEYPVFKICKFMQFDGVHISVFVGGGDHLCYRPGLEPLKGILFQGVA